MANNSDQFEEITPEEAKTSNLSAEAQAVVNSPETADEQAARFEREDLEEAARAEAAKESVTTFRNKAGKQVTKVSKIGAPIKPVSETLPKEKGDRPIESLTEMAEAGHPLTPGARDILLGGGDPEALGRHRAEVQKTADQMEPFDWTDPAEAEAWSENYDKRIAEQRELAGSEHRTVVDLSSRVEPMSDEADTLSKGRNLPQTRLEAQRAAEQGTSLEGLAEEQRKIATSAHGRELASRYSTRAARPNKGATRFLTPSLIRDYQLITGIRHRAFMKMRELVKEKARTAALAGLVRLHDSTGCDNMDCQKEMQKHGDRIISAIKPDTANTRMKRGTARGQFRSKGDRLKAKVKTFLTYHGDEPLTLQTIQGAEDQAHLKAGTRYDESAGRTSQPADSDWKETENPGEEINDWAEKKENKGPLERVALARHLNEFAVHPLFKSLVNAQTHSFLYGSNAAPITVEETVKAVSALRGSKTARPDLVGEESAIALSQGDTHENAVYGMNSLARESYNALIGTPNRVQNIETSTGKNTNVSGVQLPWEPGQKEAAAEQAKISGLDKHVAWAADAMALLDHINNSRRDAGTSILRGRDSARHTRAGVTSDTSPGAMPAEGRRRPAVTEPAGRRASTIDIAKRLIESARGLAASAGTVVQDGSAEDPYGTRARDLIAGSTGEEDKAKQIAPGSIAAAATDTRVQLGLPAKTAEEISPKIAAVASDPEALARIIPTGVPGKDFIPGASSRDSEARPGTAVRNPAAERTRRTKESIIAERDKKLAPIMARVEQHNAIRLSQNQRPHALPQALAHLGLAKEHAEIHKTANDALDSLRDQD